MNLKIQDLIDIEQFQRLQDRLNEIYSFPSAIIDNEGNVLTATAWQDICTKFHRQNRESEKQCIQSDLYIAGHLHEANPAVSYRCLHGLIDNATPIIIEGVHYGNFFTGQFFLEPPDLSFFRAQAKRYGFDEEAYIEAVKKVPIWTKEQLDSYLFFIRGLIEVIAGIGLKNLKEIEIRKKIKESEDRYRSLFSGAGDGIFVMTENGTLVEVNESFARMHGYSRDEMLQMNLKDLDTPETYQLASERMRRILAGEMLTFEVDHYHKDGHAFPLEVSASLIPIGRKSYIQSFHRGISKRKRAEQETSILTEIGQLISSTLDINEVYERVAIKVRQLIDFDRLVVNLNRPGEGILFRAYMHGLDIPGRRQGDTLPLAGSINELLMRTRKGLIIQSLSREEIYERYPSTVSTFQSGIQSMISVPLIARDEVIGVLHFQSMKQSNYNAEMLRLAERIGIQISSAIANAQLFNDLSKMDKTVRESEAKFRGIYEKSPIGIELYDREGTLVDINRACLEIFGIPDASAVAGFKLFEDPNLSEDLKARLRRGESVRYEIPFDFERINALKLYKTTKNGTIYLDLLITPFGGAKDESVIGYLVHVRDITGHKQEEERFHEMAGRLQLATVSAKAGVWDWNLQTGEMIWDSRMLELYGLTREKFSGKVEDWEQGLHPDDASRAIEECQAALCGQKDFDTEFRVQRPDGTMIYIKANGLVLRDAEGEPFRMIGLNTDISEQKRIEEEKRILEERLQRSEKMEALGQLAGGVAHDLNNVLGAMSGYSELLLEEIPEGHRSRAHAEQILRSTEKGAAIIQDLLTLARRGVTAAEVINLNHVVSDFLKSPAFKKMRDYHSHVTFRTECDENLLNIKGSMIHLEKTLINLVSNAAESIPDKGEVTIRTESRYLDKPVRGYDDVKEGDYSVLTVSDTGLGIPTTNIDKIFEPFYTKKAMGRSGTGLGLSIVWGTVKDHHGYIDVQTETGKGTTFTLYLPVTREEPIQQEQKVPIKQYRGNGESVLVVDDIAEQREVATGLLARLGYKTHSVTSGEEAVEYLKGQAVDILVLDMIMTPGIDGLETYKRVLEIHPKQKAIIVSGFSETERVKEAQKLGAGEYVRKPYLMEKIGLAVRKELDRK